jgi:Flp pilus assembly protein TadG
MNRNSGVFFRPARQDRRGQVTILFALWVPVLFGLTALVIDSGRIYYYSNELNASTQAAALAGAWAMSQAGATVTSVTNAVTTFGGTTGNDNAQANLPNVSLSAGYPALKCLTTLKSVFGVQCYGPSQSNAITVKQQVAVPMLFFPMFGGTSATLSATATACMKGASVGPFNVAIIVDSTQSMNDTDSDSNCKSTRISCALSGVEVLLKTLSPCLQSETSCGAATGGNVSNSVDRVTLLTFPPVTTATVANDYNCGKSAPTTAAYTYPLPSTSTYQIVGFSSDYRSSDTATSLNTSSNIVLAAGGTTGSSPCLQAKGGYGTYYAQVIYAAQSYLVAEQTSYPKSQNVMIILSDGDASASSSDMPGASTKSGVYMSTLQECHQAITAAAAAAAAGTRVYTVAYGAEASGCSTDTSPAITPCQAMQQMASSAAYFFSDYTATGGSSTCISASQPVTGLSQIFQVIGMDLTNVKLIPNNTT